MFYGRLAERLFGMDRLRGQPPAFTQRDDGDRLCAHEGDWRVFMIQFLNIAGLGPIFGAILGAMYGPVAYIWIVLGLHLHGSDTSTISSAACSRVRHGGCQPAGDWSEPTWGRISGPFMRIFTPASAHLRRAWHFVSGPAKLLLHHDRLQPSLLAGPDISYTTYLPHLLPD
ncbi:MAG: hypothetical protein MZV63_15915 [Marinilabiliales bacterium]|nr:hypothetical protein [Marinilabiliales bacterium]